jgi:hypothetical protein
MQESEGGRNEDDVVAAAATDQLKTEKKDSLLT